jgi:hypothetical protein
MNESGRRQRFEDLEFRSKIYERIVLFEERRTKVGEELKNSVSLRIFYSKIEGDGVFHIHPQHESSRGKH